MKIEYTVEEIPQQEELYFHYDAQGKPVIVTFNGVKYAYIHNLQGDIVGILDSNGTLAVEYKYDAWGRPLGISGSMADTLGRRNPFRYRGYVYDEESGLYYLRSRYYNPELGRFLNADNYIGRILMLGQHNQFSYCANMPVGLQDGNGHNFLEDAYRGFVWIAYTGFNKEKLLFWYSVCGGLDILGYEYSAKLLRHALQPNPSDLSFDDSSPLVEKIKNNSDFKNAMAKIINEGNYNSSETSITFESDFDLFGSLHNMQIVVAPVTIEGVNKYHVRLSDEYDFDAVLDYIKEEESLKETFMYAGAIAGNNLAFVDQYIGPVNNYFITMDFYVDR